MTTDFASARSATGVIPTVALEELFDEFGSGVVLETVAVFVGAAPGALALTITWSVMTCVAPEASVPIVQVIVPPDPAPGVQPGAVAVSVMSVGSVSVTTTFAAGLGPLFVTVSW